MQSVLALAISRALLARPGSSFVENSKKNCTKTGPQVKKKKEKLIFAPGRVSSLALSLSRFVRLVIKSKIEFQFAGFFLPPSHFLFFREDTRPSPPSRFCHPPSQYVCVCLVCLCRVRGREEKVEKTTTININDSFLFAFRNFFLM